MHTTLKITKSDRELLRSLEGQAKNRGAKTTQDLLHAMIQFVQANENQFLASLEQDSSAKALLGVLQKAKTRRGWDLGVEMDEVA